MSSTEEVRLDSKTKAEIIAESCMQLLPGVGGVLASLYFGTKQAKEFARLERFYHELAAELETLKEYILKVEEQCSDEYISLIEKLNDKVEKEHQEVKIIAYKNFMKQLLFTKTTSQNYDERKVYLELLDTLTLLDIETLIFLYKNRNEDQRSKRLIKVGELNRANTLKYAIVGSIYKLKINGLIEAYTYDLTEGADNSLNECVCVSDYGVNFIKFCLE
ncbi:hypothetical protein [Turicibacter sanguinis]|uniref:hypothetical protein n=1 Tax=Turicibacter sanguinis TaxID=154288 RepID=UPI0018AA8610|nr:hypothetical protein [Turicibacter sanguinis]MDB8553245.1 hypothetical protein [Turicibacter sanguinis]